MKKVEHCAKIVISDRKEVVVGPGYTGTNWDIDQDDENDEEIRDGEEDKEDQKMRLRLRRWVSQDAISVDELVFGWCIIDVDGFMLDEGGEFCCDWLGRWFYALFSIRISFFFGDDEPEQYLDSRRAEGKM